MELRGRADLSEDELAEVRARLGAARRGEQRAARGRATMLELIASGPRCARPTSPPRLGRERLSFKRDVRKLKELGLTESLEVGYRLSPRGRAVLDRLASGPS